MFIIFFWFGALKVFELSPANPLVESLLNRTMPLISFDQFIVIFGLFEMLIGVIFLVPRLDTYAVVFFFLHMFTTALPIILLPEIAWQSFLVPTLEGQYIIKNLALVAVALTIAASHSSLTKTKVLR